MDASVARLMWRKVPPHNFPLSACFCVLLSILPGEVHRPLYAQRKRNAEHIMPPQSHQPLWQMSFSAPSLQDTRKRGSGQFRWSLHRYQANRAKLSIFKVKLPTFFASFPTENHLFLPPLWPQFLWGSTGWPRCVTAPLWRRTLCWAIASRQLCLASFVTGVYSVARRTAGNARLKSCFPSRVALCLARRGGAVQLRPCRVLFHLDQSLENLTARAERAPDRSKFLSCAKRYVKQPRYGASPAQGDPKHLLPNSCRI